MSWRAARSASPGELLKCVQNLIGKGWIWPFFVRSFGHIFLFERVYSERLTRVYSFPHRTVVLMWKNIAELKDITSCICEHKQHAIVGTTVFQDHAFPWEATGGRHCVSSGQCGFLLLTQRDAISALALPLSAARGGRQDVWQILGQRSVCLRSFLTTSFL